MNRLNKILLGILVILLIGNIVFFKVTLQTYRHIQDIATTTSITIIKEKIVTEPADEDLQETIDKLKCESDWTNCKAIESDI